MEVRRAVGFLFFTLSVGSIVGLPNAMADNRGNDHRPPAHHGPGNAHGNKGSSKPHYDFRAQDRARLQKHYQRNLAYVNRGHRPQFVRGGYIPTTYRRYITPAPARVVHYLPPAPPGYAVGYYQGYTVVYDPATFLILNVIDLLAR